MSGQSKELILDESSSQFIFPFSLKPAGIKKMEGTLKSSGYEFFRLEAKELEGAFYGPGQTVSHDQMDQYFLPFIENLLFTEEPAQESLSRFSKSLHSKIRLLFGDEKRSFEVEILSADLFICPFQIGMISVRTRLADTNLKLSDVLHFQNQFRVLEPKIVKKKQLQVLSKDGTYDSIQDYIFKEVAPCIVPYIQTGANKTSYFGSLPYFVDERMYVVSTLVSAEEYVSNQHLFRSGQVNGYDPEGMPFISAYDPEYIDEYAKEHSYRRWAPQTQYIVSDHAFTCLTQRGTHVPLIKSEMFGQHYYNLLLHFFYKMVLLKLSYQYSLLYRRNKTGEIEQLIQTITEFSGKYHFKEISSRTEGQELAVLMNKVFHISTLYDEVKKTLDSLFRNQEKISAKRNNYLLFILTTYTVISGIYGMNLVIEDWKGKIDWTIMARYSVFEYIAFCVAISGILMGIGLGAGAIFSLSRNLIIRKKKR
ncbi:hypothetical protein CEF21_12420 [Bacillus sp. FJAT-42376]|uniref:hypothetical protein n=1 Tax=Bacillus sp. FJAT-42376 TaxID=2014076 RepID=UPI000F4DF26F|nr:hypothetical protein [Bacillus sp. FJAT-42376]AZB43042.1 hypothetical protein CEF21_12420 [Bacillus sp. FJAT-42376]